MVATTSEGSGPAATLMYDTQHSKLILVASYLVNIRLLVLLRVIAEIDIKTMASWILYLNITLKQAMHNLLLLL